MAIMEAIATTYAEADLAYVEFTGIGTDYEHLQLRASGRAYATGVNNHWWQIRLQTSGGWHSSGDYSYHMIYGSGTSVAANPNGAGTDPYFQFNGSIGNDTASTTNFSDRLTNASLVCDIFDYANTSKNTTVMALAGAPVPYSATGLGLNSGLLAQTAAITGIRIAAYNGAGAGSTLRGSVFSLYGIKSS